MTGPAPDEARMLDSIVDLASKVTTEALLDGLARAAAFAHDSARRRYGMGQAPAFVAFLSGYLEGKAPASKRKAAKP